MQKIEGFKVIEGYPNYAVSQYGNVISLNYHREGNIKLLQQFTNTKGYQLVYLYKNGKKTHKMVHRLVYSTWVGEIPDGYEVNHIDENKENNRLDNLNLMTHKENLNHGTRNERSSKALTNHPKKSKSVAQYTLQGELVKVWESGKEAGRNGFHQGNISACCNNNYGKNKSNIYKNYIWQYQK